MNTHGAEGGGSAGGKRRRRTPPGPSREGKGGGGGRPQPPRPPVPAVVGLSVLGWRGRGRGRNRWEEGEEASGVQVAAVRRRPARAPPRRSARRPGGAVALAIAVSGEIERGWGEVRFFFGAEAVSIIRFVGFGAEARGGSKRQWRSWLSAREAGEAAIGESWSMQSEP